MKKNTINLLKRKAEVNYSAGGIFWCFFGQAKK